MCHFCIQRAAEDWTRYEAAAPIAGAGASHLASASTFPHIYGPIAWQAIAQVGVLAQDSDGFRWPTILLELDRFLASG